MNNAFPSDDGNFKRGAFKPIAILLVLALVAGGAAFAFLGAHNEAQSLSKEDVNKEILDIQLLPRADQLPRWRKWADAENEPRLEQEAFVHLAWAKDKESVPSMIKALSAVDHGVRGTAATALADLGSPDADAAKPALLKALAEADSSDKPQISWALVALKESSAFDQILGEYRLGHLARDPAARRVPRVRRGQAGRPRVARQNRRAQGRRQQQRAPARRDDALARRRPAMGRHADHARERQGRRRCARSRRRAREDRQSTSATEPLVDALTKADKGSREKFLQALRDGDRRQWAGVGAQDGQSRQGRHARSSRPSRSSTCSRSSRIRAAATPFTRTSRATRKPHWKVEAAMRMAEIGDVRAAEVLGWRMEQDPLKLYNDVDWPELRRDDNERVFAARMLADLAVIHPEKRDYLLKNAEPGSPLLGRPREQAAAARQRHALSRARRIAKSDPASREDGRTRKRSSRRRAPSRRSRIRGPRRRARSAISGGPRSPARLDDLGEAAPPAHEEARRVVGIAEPGRTDDSRE